MPQVIRLIRGGAVISPSSFTSDFFKKAHNDPQLGLMGLVSRRPVDVCWRRIGEAFENSTGNAPATIMRGPFSSVSPNTWLSAQPVTTFPQNSTQIRLAHSSGWTPRAAVGIGSCVVLPVLAHQFDVPSYMRTCRGNRAPRIIASSTMLFIHGFTQFAVLSGRNDAAVSRKAGISCLHPRDVTAEKRPLAPLTCSPSERTAAYPQRI